MSDYADHDAVGLAELVRTGQATPADLAIEARRRMDAADAQYNFVAHRFDVTAALDALPDEAPFRGVPFLFKDQLELRGLPMTYGSRLLRDHRPDHTHPLAQRFVDAGFVPLGRTTMSELGLVPTTESALFGATHNPWRRGHSPGGSSGGAAVAVAAGVVPLAHAVDGGGSIRIPASACGLVGLKPSRGRLPDHPDDPPQGFVSHFAVTRTVRDAATLLDVVAAREPRGRFSLPAPARPWALTAADDPAPLRIGVTATGFFGEPLHPEVRDALDRTASRLADLGHRVAPVASPVHAERFAAAFEVLWCTGAGVFFKIAQRDAPLPPLVRRLTRRPGAFRMLTALARGTEAFTRRLAAREARLSPSDLWLAEQALEQTAADLRDFHDDHDLWLTATLTRPPPPHGDLDPNVSDDELKQQLFGLIAFTPIANATGVPAISIPAGLSTGGLPLGAQFIAPMGAEDRLLALAGQVERAHGWPRRTAARAA